MERRKFDDGTASLSLLALGGSRIGSVSSTVSRATVERVVQTALEYGITVFDTANIYGQGDSERELGRLLAAWPEVTIVTKVGKQFPRWAQRVSLLKPLARLVAQLSPAGRRVVLARRSSATAYTLDPSQLAVEVDRSRQRLNRDTLDGLLLHGPSPEHMNDPRLQDELARIRDKGWARHVGVSVEDLAGMASAVQLPHITLVQISAADLAGAQQSGLLQQAHARGIGVMVREVLRSRAPDQSVAQAIAAASEPPSVTTVVVGTTNPAHLAEIAGDLPQLERSRVQ
ncbi:aldo/keto reductase [Devosia sp. CN2-171]|uniref:aldo/keto reductase n=1 Tax=Devosia sp. CN2-171 TaxID=3400909 RepID=UPI003BF829E4